MVQKLVFPFTERLHSDEQWLCHLAVAGPVDGPDDNEPLPQFGASRDRMAHTLPPQITDKHENAFKLLRLGVKQSDRTCRAQGLVSWSTFLWMLL